MPTMSNVERAFCRSAPWRSFARGIVLPWVLDGRRLSGDVLEIGGGSGAMAAALLRRFPGIRLTVTDYDDAMANDARQRLARFGDRVVVQRADATALPFPDDSFDAVVSFIMLHHVIDWEAAVGEAARVLRPGGQLLGYDLSDSRVARVIHRVDRSPHRLLTTAELRATVSDAGFHGTVRAAFGHELVRFALTTTSSTDATAQT